MKSFFWKKWEKYSRTKSRFFSLPISNNKIKVTEFADYKKLHSFNEKEFIIRYIIELDTNIVSYLKSFYDIKLKDYEIIKAIDNLRKDLDNKRENFLLGFHLYILENLKKGENEDTLLDNIKKAECVLNYKFYKTKDDVNEKKYLILISEIKELKENILKRYDIIHSLLLKSFYLKLKNLKLKEKLQEFINFINDQLCCYMEEELLLCMMYLFDDNEVTTFFKQKKVESMTWDLLHLRFLKERILVNKKDKILNFPLILSSDNAFNKIMEINPVRAVVYYKKVSEIDIINRKNTLKYIVSSDKINDDIKREIVDKILNREKNRKNKIDCIDFKTLSKRLKKDLENLKKGSEILWKKFVCI